VKPLAAVSTLAFVLASAVIGARLLLLARRTRGLPELLLGLGLFCLGGVAFPVGVLLGTGLFEGSAVLWLQAFAILPMGVSGISVLVFTRVVFRADSRVGLAVAATLSLAWLAFLATGWLALWQSGEPLPPVGGRVIARHALMLLGFGWTATESFVYFAKLRRRIPIGLADPIVANRILLWAMCGGCAALLNVVLVAVAIAGGDTLAAGPLRVLIALGGSGAAVCLLLGFFPPRRYLEAVQQRAPQSTG